MRELRNRVRLAWEGVLEDFLKKLESPMREDPEYDGKDRTWLHRLQEDPLLFETQSFTIE